MKYKHCLIFFMILVYIDGLKLDAYNEVESFSKSNEVYKKINYMEAKNPEKEQKVDYVDDVENLDSFANDEANKLTEDDDEAVEDFDDSGNDESDDFRYENSVDSLKVLEKDRAEEFTPQLKPELEDYHIDQSGFQEDTRSFPFKESSLALIAKA